MNLSELQKKEIINISDGKRIGLIIDVIVNRNTAEKYAKRMNRLGYILKNKAEYDISTFRLTYHKI